MILTAELPDQGSYSHLQIPRLHLHKLLISVHDVCVYKECVHVCTVHVHVCIVYVKY